MEKAKAEFGNNFGIVYRLYCQKTGVSYVGETTDFSNLTCRGKAKKRHRGKPTRLLTHYNALAKGCHPHPRLQEAYDLNPTGFEDEPLEVVPVDIKEWGGKKPLREREKHWKGVYNATETQPNRITHYPLTPDELAGLKATGLVNNTTLVYFIIKLQNPWMDRPVKIEPLAIAAEWEIPESSVYEAILKLKNQGILKITKSTMTVEWNRTLEEEPPDKESHSQQESHSDNSESILECQNEFRDLRTNSDNSESIPRSRDFSRDLRTNSEISENQVLKVLPDKNSSTPQTIQTNKTIQTLSESEREDFDKFCRKKVEELPRKPTLPDRWIEKNFEELFKQWQKQRATDKEKEEIRAKRDRWREQLHGGIRDA